MIPSHELNGNTAEASREAASINGEGDVLPAYQENAPPETSTAAFGPTISSPFNFPSSDLPPYSPTASFQKPFAVPQKWPDAAAPFLAAYSPSLLKYGITSQNWLSFLEIMSAFLTASVSKRSFNHHARDITTELGKVPQQLGKNVLAQAKETGRVVASNAKKGNPVGVVLGVVGGSIALTVVSTLGLIGSVFSLPGTAINAAANPKTPRGRAELYAAAANRDWFHARGLEARLLDTVELAEVVGASVEHFLSTAETQARSSLAKLHALRDWIEELELPENESDENLAEFDKETPSAEIPALAEPKQSNAVTPSANAPSSSSGKGPASSESEALPVGNLQLGTQTLWLVLVPVAIEKVSQKRNKLNKQKSEQR
ncbi:hypothetical protein EJ08DRAFT_648504 [Tothia fuscella]|uniref:Uncharacterized protein n=1 Tax=Tothia fuscella TaxID=1048955 RepID=A0A9P4NV55_9PEZI|nr:hypothetical protein EJ08DRAFT_648504 [Tothia fuscella]